jgi:hypothetical protein
MKIAEREPQRASGVAAALLRALGSDHEGTRVGGLHAHSIDRGLVGRIVPPLRLLHVVEGIDVMARVILAAACAFPLAPGSGDFPEWPSVIVLSNRTGKYK